MTNNNGYIAAVDIGTTKIVTVVARKKENGKFEILGISKTPSKGVKRGVVLNIEETVSAIQTTVEAVQLKSGVVFKDVFVGIAGQHIRSVRNRAYLHRESHDHEITREDIRELINDMHKIPIEVGEEIIHVIPQNYTVDNEIGIKKPIGMSGKRIEGNFHIVIGQIATAKNVEKCINRAELSIKSLILEQLASSRAVLSEDEKEAGVALVDIGGGTTDLAIYYDNIIRHTAVVPFGGNVVTQDIKEGCAILNREAEALKIQYGSALGDIAPEDKVVTIPGISGRESKEISFKSLAYIIQSRMEEIIDAICFEIENSGYFDKLSAGIVLTGGGALLRHLPQLVKFKTGLDVKLGYPTESMDAEMDEDINQPIYATSVGLIMKGYEHMEEMQEEEEKQSPLKSFPVNKENNTDGTGKNKKSKILENFKKTITNIFEENDAEM
jgi:cell division protein FtsA